VSAILTDVCVNAMLESAVAGAPGTALFLGLHTALGAAGAEIPISGSPAYGRKAITWGTAGTPTARTKDIVAAQTFDVPAGTTVRAVQLWSASTAGTSRAWLPAGSTARRSFSVIAGDLAGNTIQSPGHGLAAGQSVVFWASIGAVLPAPLAEDTEYFVIAAGLTADVFEVSTTLAGSAVDLTAIGDGDVQKFTPEVFAAQGTYQVSSFPISLPA
jgi:hypothetical protein